MAFANRSVPLCAGFDKAAEMLGPAVRVVRLGAATDPPDFRASPTAVAAAIGPSTVML
eukprot:SAG31_NODE_40672_length_279_cov_1.155556_1_plen_57_part_01